MGILAEKRLIVKTGIVWNGCEVFLGVPMVANHRGLVKMFFKFFAWLRYRSSQVNVSDMIRGQELIGKAVSDGNLGKVLNEHNSVGLS